MNQSIEPKTKIHMKRHGFQRMKTKRGSSVFCESGVLWVTQSGDYRDYILWPGDMMTVSKRGKVLVEAMRDTDFHVA